ncbi:hypothetical protein FOL47_003578 [Perkinsus chesapeaki]|uniref:Uncharacterized protein n=1 Tax=Perkinsus chesapeaki TaxID=330153 RepID=A0A7J6M7Q9_PERCH|nr:hypothetical protein FOL47_003578 [Perkinsus chesapeaki]
MSGVSSTDVNLRRPSGNSGSAARSRSCVAACLPGSHTRARSQDRTAAHKGQLSDTVNSGEEKPKRKVWRARPSAILRMKPRNLCDCMEEFFDSACSKNPIFEYDGDPSEVFERHSNVDCSLLEEAQCILDQVVERFGSSEAFLESAFGTDRVDGAELRRQMEGYLAELGLFGTGVVEVKSSSKLLSVANVVKTPPDKHVLHLTDTPVPAGMIPGLCAHEIGTHLLRMLNNDLQPWSIDRRLSSAKERRFKLEYHFATEEGLATLNSLVQSEKRPHNAELFLWSPALRYWATVQGQNRTFVQLYHLLERYIQDPIRRFKLCSRVKRGIRNTGVPSGACTLDQAVRYFLGAVDILRHLESIDFVLLYCGLLSRKDLHKVRFCARRHAIRLPRFLGTVDRTKKYIDGLRQVARVNRIPIGESLLGDAEVLKRSYNLTQTKSYFRRRLLRDLAMKVHYDRSRHWKKPAAANDRRKDSSKVRGSKVGDGEASSTSAPSSSSGDEVFEVSAEDEEDSPDM